MNWKLTVSLGLVAMAAFAAGQAFRTNRAEAGCGPAVVATTSTAPIRSATSKDELVAELTAIIRETESSDTFLFTLQTLTAMNPRDKSLLPLAIRKADKLGLMDGMMANPRPEQQYFAQIVSQLGADTRILPGSYQPYPMAYPPAPVYPTVVPTPAVCESAAPWNPALSLTPSSLPPSAPASFPVMPQPLPPSTN